MKNRLPPRVIALYCAGVTAESVKTFTFGLFLLFFYTSVLRVPGSLVGAAMAVALIWDAMIDPVVGCLSDRTQSRFGRRHTFMLGGSVCMGVFFFALFSPPDLPVSALAAWLVVFSLLLRTAHSCFLVPYYALGSELISDYAARTKLTSIRAAFGLAGTLLAAASAFLLFFPDNTSGIDPKLNRDGYSRMAVCFGIGMMIAGSLATLGTRKYAHLSKGGSREQTRVLSSVRSVSRNRNYTLLNVSASIFFLTAVINASLAIHYFKHFAKVDSSRQLTVIQIAFYVGALAGVLFWMFASRRWHKHHLYFVSTAGTGALMALAYLIVGPGRPLGLGAFVPIACGHALAGFFGSGLWVLPSSMIADLADEDELIGGVRREGVLFGVHSLTQQVAASLAILFSGVAVERFAGLVPGAAEQSGGTVERIGILYGVLPAALLITAAILAAGYSLTRQRVDDIQTALRRGRAAAAARSGA